MLTLTLQTVTGVLKLVFVGAAFAVTRGDASGRLTVEAWRLTVYLFGISAVCGLVHSVWAILAFRAGPGAAVYESLMLWMPGMNYGRIAIAIAWGGMVMLLPRLFALPLAARRTVYATVGVTALAAGLLGGYLEGGYDTIVHSRRMALLEVVEMVAVAAGLLVTLALRTVDIWLWLAMVVYTFRQTVNVVVWSTTGWLAVHGAWAPPLWLPSAVGTFSWLAMIALAAWRVRLSRRGQPVRAVFERAVVFSSGLERTGGRGAGPPAARP